VSRECISAKEGQMKNSSATNRELIEEISDLRQRIKELEQSEKELRQFRSLVEATNDWVWEINSDGFYTYSSPKIRDILGYEPEEVIGKTPFDLMPKDEAERVAPLFKEIMESRQSFSGLDNVSLHRDGRKIVLETNGAPIIDAEGNFVGYRGIDRDITGRRKAEEALLENEERYRMLADNATDVIFICGFDMKYKYISPSVKKIRGFSPEELVGEPVSHSIKAEGLELMSNAIKEELEIDKTGTADLDRTRVMEVEMFCKDGSTMWTEVKTSALRDNKGDPTAIMGIARDITERKKIENALKESEEKHRVLVEKADEAIVIMQDAAFVFVNRKMSDLLGVPVGNLEDRPFVDFIWPEDRELVSSAHRKRLAGETVPNNYDFRLIGAEGKLVWVSLSATMIQWKGKPATLGLMTDITERKKAEEALAESEAKYRTVVESSLVGVFIVQDNLLCFVNKQWCEMYGYAYDEVVGKVDPLDLAHPDDRKVIEDIRKRPSGKADRTEYEMRCIRKDGTIITVRVLGSRALYKGHPAVSGTVIDITEHRKVEEELQQKTALLEAQVNASPDGILIVDKGKKILQNQQVNDLLKIPKHIADNDDDEAQIGWVRGLVKNPEEFYKRVSYMFAHPDETIRDELELKDGTVLDRYSGPVIGESGKRYGRIWTFRNITERKRSEEALRVSQSRLAEAMDLANIVYWEVDPADNVYVFNDPFYAFYCTTAEAEGGYRMTREEYFKRFVHPDDRSDISSIVAQRMSTSDLEILHDIEHRIIRRDGEVRHILVRARAVKDKSGRIIKRYGANQDITDRKEMEKTIETSEEKFRRIFEESPIGKIMVGADFHFISANEAFRRMLGYTEQELSSLSFKDITHPDHDIEDTLHVNDLMNGKISVYQAEKRYIRKDKDIVWGSTRVKIIRDKDGRFLYFLTTIEDITQRKQTEEEKAHLESQLFQSQKMEAIGTLAGSIAHDFNNILTVISGFGSLLQMDIPEDDPKKAYIDQILASSEKAAQLTQGLLAFSRKQQISLRPLDINDTIRSTSKLLKTLLREDIELKIRFSEETSIIMADASQMDQILFNLAANARDAMPQGGALIVETKIVELDDDFIRIHGYGESGKYALLSVSDTGIGMDEATKSKIFDPFFTTKAVGKGTGLGLSTVYGIVKQHNGYITVYSEPGRGTTFHIYLPLINDIVRQEKEARAPIKGGSETILVAEDDDVVRRLIKTVLTEYGYSIIEAVDGEDAIDRFAKLGKRIDLIILDTVMPKKNGREVYDEIKSIKPDSKVIFTSGYTRDITLDKGMAQGDKFEFIPKPISPYVLLQKVRQVLDDSEVVY
jgi:two-component system, cell cycle sensor histidine kinase and response regulator CckA